MYLENRNKAGDSLHTCDNGTSIQIDLIHEWSYYVHTSIINFVVSNCKLESRDKCSAVSHINVVKSVLYHFDNYNVSILCRIIFHFSYSKIIYQYISHPFPHTVVVKYAIYGMIYLCSSVACIRHSGIHSQNMILHVTSTLR